MGKLVMDTIGNVYSLDRKSNCVCKLSSDLKLNKTITTLELDQYEVLWSRVQQY
jgi:hypothetical protein